MDLLEIGKIVKTHGLKGRMKVISYLESDSILKSLEKVLVRHGKQKEHLKKIKDIKINRKYFFLEFEGVDDVDAASELVGCEILMPSDILEELPEGEYYWRDIVGLEVVTEDGEVLGRIERVFSAGGNDVYVCAGGEREILLPAIADVVRKIDIENRRMVVRLLEGL